MEFPDEIDILLLSHLQGDLPGTPRPYHSLARELGISAEELLERIRTLMTHGIIREVKAVLGHRKAGFTSGAMVAWTVPQDSLDEIGERIARRASVSHCYERPDFGRYTIFSMIHGRTDEEVDRVIQEIAAELSLRDYRVYRTLRELKKSSMKYFKQGGEHA
ncbi:MAG: Lrp/AsnC family transcriptional regulator [Desulfomonilia bacterium]